MARIFILLSREKQILHLDQDLAHHVFLFGVIQHMMIGLEGPFVGDVFEDDRFAVFRADFVEIQIGQCRDFAIDLSPAGFRTPW